MYLRIYRLHRNNNIFVCGQYFNFNYMFIFITAHDFIDLVNMFITNYNLPMFNVRYLSAISFKTMNSVQSYCKLLNEDNN